MQTEGAILVEAVHTVARASGVGGAAGVVYTLAPPRAGKPRPHQPPAPPPLREEARLTGAGLVRVHGALGMVHTLTHGRAGFSRRHARKALALCKAIKCQSVHTLALPL